MVSTLGSNIEIIPSEREAGKKLFGNSWEKRILIQYLNNEWSMAPSFFRYGRPFRFNNRKTIGKKLKIGIVPFFFFVGFFVQTLSGQRTLISFFFHHFLLLFTCPLAVFTLVFTFYASFTARFHYKFPDFPHSKFIGVVAWIF